MVKTKTNELKIASFPGHPDPDQLRRNTLTIRNTVACVQQAGHINTV